MPRRSAVASRPAAPPEHPADAALVLGAAGRDRLSDDLRPGFDAIRAAFDHAAAGREDDAREALQAIGLGSPFLDWKLLVRGLLAYYAGDDSRALDNWARLSPTRLPARLVAPLRFDLEPAFRASHPAKAHAELLRRADQLRGGLLPGLRALQGYLSGPYHLVDAFRRAETLLPTLRRDLNNAVPRVAEAFRTAIIAAGSPDDLQRYRHLFGTPPDDPKFERLEALALEERRQWHEAHKVWQKYQATLAHLSTWSAADIARARALVWCRMGRNATEHADERFFTRPQRFKPTPGECFRRALELAPDMRDAHEELFLYYRDANQLDKAKSAGQALVERFPDHVPTLEALSELAREEGDAATARDYLRRAVAANPLDAQLRERLAIAHRDSARALAAAGDIAAARAELDAGAALRERRADAPSLALAAVIAFRAGESNLGEELAGQAFATGARGLAAYAILAEAARLRLPAKAKRRCGADFAALLAAPPDARTAAELMAAYSDQTRQRDDYVGRASHQAKIQKYVKAAVATAGEADLERLALVLAITRWDSLLKAAATRGQRLAKDNPFFLYFEALAHSRNTSSPWKIVPLLDRAQLLAEAQPSDNRMRTLLADIAELRAEAGPPPLFDAFGQFFGSGFDYDDDGPY